MAIAIGACGPDRVGDQLDEVGSESTSDSVDGESTSESEGESSTASETETRAETETETSDPLCDEVHGMLVVTADTPPASLECIRQIDHLIIENTVLTDLSVFPALEWVEDFWIHDNPQMTSLAGADALVHVGRLSLGNMPVLTSLEGFDPELIDSLQLSSGLDGLISLDSTASVSVLDLVGWDRPDVSPVVDLQPNVVGYFTVRLRDTAALVDLSAIATCCGGASLQLIVEAPGQVDFLGLESQTVMGRLELRGTTIESFAGLENLEQLDELRIVEDCPYTKNTLTSLAGLGSLAQVGRIEITSNPDLLTLAGLDALAFVDVLSVSENNAMTELGFPPGLVVATQARIIDNDSLPEAEAEAFLASIEADEEQACGNGLQDECDPPGDPCPP